MEGLHLTRGGADTITSRKTVRREWHKLTVLAGRMQN